MWYVISTYITHLDFQHVPICYRWQRKSTRLYTVIIDGPESVNAVDGTTVQFSCTVIAEEIDYFVNGTRANQQNIVDAGFIDLYNIAKGPTHN